MWSATPLANLTRDAAAFCSSLFIGMWSATYQFHIQDMKEEFAVPSSLGCGLQLMRCRRSLRFRFFCSSLFIGMWSATQKNSRARAASFAFSSLFIGMWSATKCWATRGDRWLRSFSSLFIGMWSATIGNDCAVRLSISFSSLFIGMWSATYGTVLLVH